MAFRVLFAIAVFYNQDIGYKNWFFLQPHQSTNLCQNSKKHRDSKKNLIFKLLNSLYRLKQFPYLLYKRPFIFLLKQLDFKQTHTDHTIFITRISLNTHIISTFVDNIKNVVIKKIGFIQRVRENLTIAFSIVDMGTINFYLGLKVKQDCQNRTIKLF